ncbi:MAG: hypothetical protein FRX48_03842 [Lasallia pustulata]|uniref:Serine-threonine/tyrosine-protein kinase catalytic domain n=1 Tax=Lasallia pustulata TaxID=136370 RepID=A0A1W5CZ82_9LECA|nr:MAG: hypothetical protein FRX48_03842 [Lasallia pustulata]SLM36188.1 Serine-threonine/tyrosine-protein kinase catalytic domain [Lasallia pustulata]
MPLKDLMQRPTHGQIVEIPHSSPSLLQEFVGDEDAQRAGLATHARLRQLTHNVVTEQRDLSIPQDLLDTCDDDLVLVPGTLAETIRTSSGQSRTIQRKVLVEYKYNNGPNVESQVHQLVSLLSSAGGSDLRTLQCKGYVDERDDTGRYAFVFSYPNDTDLSLPISLNEVLRGTTKHARLSLPDRFHVAQVIANSVSVLHADGWVHKSIRSHSIVFFERRDGPLTYDHPFLVDFEYSRPENSDTMWDSDEDAQRNLYRHPARQYTPTESFTKLHDIYALGVVLLEIGLWQTAFEIQEQAIRRLGIAAVVGEWKLKKVYIEAAGAGLIHQMGPAYSNAVLTCLSGDLGHVTVQSDLQMPSLRGDSQTAGTRADIGMIFYQKVVEMLDPSHLSK